MSIFSLFMVLIIIASILLVIVVMAQNPKGGGLSGTFGGTSSATFGVQRTNEFMDKATWTLGSFIVILIMLSVILTAKPSRVIPSQRATESPVNPQSSEQQSIPVPPVTETP